MKSKRKGRLVVIEGGVGCGKTTLYNKLKRLHPGWKFYREPGGTPFGERVRKAVQGLYGYPVDKFAALLAYNASRANLIRTKVIPDIKNGKTVVLNRYWYSTYAYQGAEGVDKKTIKSVCKLSCLGLEPDLVIHLDQKPEVGLIRKMGKRDADRYDKAKLNFHRKLRKNYLELGKHIGSKWRIIDSSKPKSEVFNLVYNLLSKYKIV